MKTFKDFNIKPQTKGFVGDSLKINKILNREIIVHDFKLEPTKIEKFTGECLHMQFSLAGTMHVLFTGATGLIDQIRKVPKEDFPFTTTIVEENDRYIFT